MMVTYGHADSETIDMPVCEHLTPIKFNCIKCNRIYPLAETKDLTLTRNDILNIIEIERRVKVLENVFNEMAKEVTRMTETFGRIYELAENAEKAQMIFAQKVHDLKYIDKKRDDVINELCQKVENIGCDLKHFMLAVVSNVDYKSYINGKPTLLKILAETLGE